jgi:CxxC motif-containing protein
MKEMVCIMCPVGCHLEIDEHQNVTGNRCPRGIAYAIKEVTNPTRVLTTTVRTTHDLIPRMSVKSAEPIPKELIFPAMEQIDSITVERTTHVGDVVYKNIMDSGIDLIATKNVVFEYNSSERK